MTAPGTQMLEGLRLLENLPDWLRQDRLERAMTLIEARAKRIRLDAASATGWFMATVGGCGNGDSVAHMLGAVNLGRSAVVDAVRSRAPFGEQGWRCLLPELGLVLETLPAESGLQAQPILTDATRAQVILEEGMRAGSPALADIRIERCTPSVARSKRNRCTVVYRLEYGPEAAGRDWPEAVVAKTHRGDKGSAAYRAMCALWSSSLRSNGAVTIAEPLGFLPELNVLIQRAVPGETTLGDRIECMLLCDPGERGDRENVRELLGKTARGLSALHGCGLHGPPFGWDEEMAEVREMMGRLTHWVPRLEAQVSPALDRLEELAIHQPPQVPVPSHGSFRPAQVLVHDGHIAFIDFDGLCEAEPAADLALFSASMKQKLIHAAARAKHGGSSLAWLQARLPHIDELSALFLDEYERTAPVSRERLALWETLYLTRYVLNTWEKVRPEHLENSMAILEQHLGQGRLPLM
jgi:phosphotransferase family enzyme